MKNINTYIDHTLLKPEATANDIETLCVEAMKYQFASVCVAPRWVRYAANMLAGNVPVTTVIDFPHGNGNPSDKKNQQIKAISNGAKEFDFVISIGDIKGGLWDHVEEEIAETSYDGRIERPHDFIKKYIIEIGYLTDDEIYRVCDLLIKYEIDFVKTCTGYGPRGVTVDDIVKIKKYVGDRIKIKASGGIKTYDFCKQLIDVGANRIGCSNSINILKESSNEREENTLEKDRDSY